MLPDAMLPDAMLPDAMLPDAMLPQPVLKINIWTLKHPSRTKMVLLKYVFLVC
jgi:hypothetical protein